MLETTAVLISFILIVLVVQLVFSEQNKRTFESVFEALGRDISTSIDRAAAAAGNIQIQQDIPKGLRFKLDIDQKALIVKYGEKSSVRTFFSSLIRSGPYSFENPKSLCIVKTINDNNVYITNRTCSCNTKDDACNPECKVENKCDPLCVNDNITGVCNSFCAKENPYVCDMNCYKNSQTGVCEKSCIKENERDGICSPDCNNLKKGVCDLDCYDQYSNGKTGICDPDCPPKGQIIEQEGVKYKEKDGKCYTGCMNSSVQINKNPSPLTGSCIPFSSSSSFNDANSSTDLQCVGNHIWSCGQDVVTCASCFQPCIGDPGNAGIKNPESLSACCTHTPNSSLNQVYASDPVCCCEYNGGTCEPSTREICVASGKHAFPADSQYCKQSSLTPTAAKIRLVSDGVCDLDCKDSKNICDPDCPDSAACQNICTKENQKAIEYPCCEGLIACPGDGICRKADNPLSCCGNGFCEGRPGTLYGWGPGNKTRWETAYTCQQDCGQATQPSCQPGGSFTSSVCYEDVFQGDKRVGDTPSWQPGTISICDSEVKKFLDRRNWDINEVIKTIRADTPEGWAFDASRYIRACQRNQNPSYTVGANEKYTKDSYTCCCLNECPDDRATYIGSECCGVGYCADHASAILSIIRTLGVPDKDAYITFDIAGDCRRHAFVLMKCDPELKNKQGLWPNECNGNDNRWLRLDATGHFVAFVDQTNCDVMCIWWNDKGLYALNEGKINDNSGYAIPPGVRCSGNWDPTNSRCKQTNVDCQLDKLCQLAGAPQGFVCRMP